MTLMSSFRPNSTGVSVWTLPLQFSFREPGTPYFLIPSSAVVFFSSLPSIVTYSYLIVSWHAWKQLVTVAVTVTRKTFFRTRWNLLWKLQRATMILLPGDKVIHQELLSEDNHQPSSQIASIRTPLPLPPFSDQFFSLTRIVSYRDHMKCMTVGVIIFFWLSTSLKLGTSL